MWTIVLIDCPRFMRAVQVGVHRLSVTMPPSKRKQANKSNGERAPQVKVARARAAAASSTASTGAALDDAMEAEPIGTHVLLRCAHAMLVLWLTRGLLSLACSASGVMQAETCVSHSALPPVPQMALLWTTAVLPPVMARVDRWPAMRMLLPSITVRLHCTHCPHSTRG